MAIRKPQKSLKAWTAQDWGTKSGKKSSKTGERQAQRNVRILRLVSSTVHSLRRLQRKLKSIERYDTFYCSNIFIIYTVLDD